MNSQKSAEPSTSKLYLVGTPIGNLEDMTYRAIRILQEADIIAAEDTRNTIKLCNHFEITTPLISYHEHNIQHGGEQILTLLEEGKTIALVSDAGLPCISDPGADIATKAIEAGYDVVPIPGANAAITSLIASGLRTQPFMFYGFLARNKRERYRQIEQLKTREETLIFYEAPHRLKETLAALLEQIDGTRKVVLARELTKRFEEFLRGTLEEAVNWAKTERIRGEFCIILEHGDGMIATEHETPHWEKYTVKEHVEKLIEESDLRSKEAIREVAKMREMSRRDVYQKYHVE